MQSFYNVQSAVTVKYLTKASMSTTPEALAGLCPQTFPWGQTYVCGSMCVLVAMDPQSV